MLQHHCVFVAGWRKVTLLSSSSPCEEKLKDFPNYKKSVKQGRLGNSREASVLLQLCRRWTVFLQKRPWFVKCYNKWGKKGIEKTMGWCNKQTGRVHAKLRVAGFCLFEKSPAQHSHYIHCFPKQPFVLLYSKSSQRWARYFQSNKMSPLAFMKHTVNRLHKAVFRPWSYNRNVLNRRFLPQSISTAVLSGSLCNNTSALKSWPDPGNH